MIEKKIQGLLPESVVFLSPSQAGGFSGHQGAVSSVANQIDGIENWGDAFIRGGGFRVGQKGYPRHGS